MKRDDISGLLPSMCFSLLTRLLSCEAVCTGPEGAIETTSVCLVGEDWLSTSLQNVTKSLLFDSFVKDLSMHSSLGLNSLSTSFEELSCLVSFAVVVYFSLSRGCLTSSYDCSL